MKKLALALFTTLMVNSSYGMMGSPYIEDYLGSVQDFSLHSGLMQQQNNNDKYISLSSENSHQVTKYRENQKVKNLKKKVDELKQYVKANGNPNIKAIINNASIPQHLHISLPLVNNKNTKNVNYAANRIEGMINNNELIVRGLAQSSFINEYGHKIYTKKVIVLFALKDQNGNIHNLDEALHSTIFECSTKDEAADLLTYLLGGIPLHNNIINKKISGLAL